MQPEWKCLGGVRGDLKQKPLTPFWSSHSHSSCCLSLCLPLSSSSIFFLPPLRLDPWLWLWAQQPCNPPLPCSKGLSYLRTEASMQAFIWKEKKKKASYIRVCVFVRVCVRALQTTKLCTNSEWWLTSCGSLWLWESVHLAHFREKLSLPDLHKSACDMTDKFRQKNSKNEEEELAELVLQTSPWEIKKKKTLSTAYIMGWDSALPFLLKPASLWYIRRPISEKSIKITVRRDHGDEVGDLCSVRGHFDLPHQGEAAYKIKAMRAENNTERRGWNRWRLGRTGVGERWSLLWSPSPSSLVIFHILVEDEEENLQQNLGLPHDRLKPLHLDSNIVVLFKKIIEASGRFKQSEIIYENIDYRSLEPFISSCCVWPNSSMLGFTR